MPTYEMFWDCPSCGTKKLLGKTHRHCPACGTVQDPALRYFPPESEKVAVEDHAFVGVDWVCERCDTPNSNAASHCVNCGDGREGKEKDAKRSADVDAGAQKGEHEKPKPAEPPPPPPSAKPARAAAGLGCLGLPALVVVGLIVVCAGLFCLFSRSSPTEVKVTGHEWSRQIAIEKLSTTQDSAWCDSLPKDARAVTRSRKEKGSRKVPDGQTCKTVNEDQGDGTFKTRQDCKTKYRNEPIFEDWCTFSVDRWKEARTEKAGGKSLTPAPSWPKVKVDGCSRVGCTREGKRTETYTVRFTDADGKAQSCNLAESKWRSMAVGSRWKASKGMVTGGLSCSDLQPL
ncbi:MAG: hypothetical protein KC621_32260 [Myxococcales bacterium]|nr:hypothetical protein [Myxococcales bacterium]